MKKLVVVTGMSGAGKSLTLNYLEDIGFYCVDNLPPALISKFAELCSNPGSEINNIALGIDIRGGKLFNDFFNGLTSLKAHGYSYDILFLDCTDDVLIKRYKETRRSHPLSREGRIETGIERERAILEEVKKIANFKIDTTNLLTRELREQITNIFQYDQKFENLIISVLSFGFKYGIPADADLVFDVRFIPNPFYVTELREFTGLDKRVSDYVLNWPESKEFLKRLTDFLEFLIPNYIIEGKNQLVIGIGCTGGKHRSVTLAEELFKAIKANDHSVIINHRDIAK